MMATLIDLQRVSVMRRERRVLEEVSLRVETGEHLAILGPNGCGKSTLLKTLACELYPVAEVGTHVRLFGRERWDVLELRRRLGVVSTDAPSATMLRNTGLDAVVTGFFSSAMLWPHLEVTTAMWRLAEGTLARVGASHLAGQTVGTMSAGEQRRVLIARALAASLTHRMAGEDVDVGESLAHPEQMLLLDEPSNALDLVAQRTLRELLRGLARSGTTVLLITHQVADIFPEIEQVLLLRAGRVFRKGSRQEMLTEPVLSTLFGVPVAVTERDGVVSAS